MLCSCNREREKKPNIPILLIIGKSQCETADLTTCTRAGQGSVNKILVWQKTPSLTGKNLKRLIIVGHSTGITQHCLLSKSKLNQYEA